MAASRIIMQDFFIKYEEILLKADLIITLMKVYVDDGRQVTSLLRMGMRYCLEEKGFVWTKEAEEEDKRKDDIGEGSEIDIGRHGCSSSIP